MTTSYIALARENREKALAGLNHGRRPILSMPGFAVYPKATSRPRVPVFMSSRNPSLFAGMDLH